MEPSEVEYDRLLHRIYDTVGHPRAWQAFYAQLAALIDATTIHVLAFDKRHQALSFSDGFNLPPAGEILYIQRYHRLDPRLELFWSYPVGKWFHCHQHFDDVFVQQNRFFQEFVIPVGRRYVSACKILENETVTVIFACLRTAAQGPFPPAMAAFLERLTPHLERAAQLQAQRYVFSTDALVGHAFVNRSRQPVILTSTEGELLRHNEPAQHLLQSTSLVRIAGRRIVLPEPFYSRFLEDCAETERRVRSGEPRAYEDTAHYRVMRIPGEAAPPARRQGHGHGAMTSQGGTDAANSGLPAVEPGADSSDMLYVFYNLIVPGEVSATFGLRTIAMLIFYHPRSAPPVDEDLLAAAFDLTPAESRIAHLLADGLTPKDIATRVGVQPDTVRKQMQSIYQKTGTNRQPDLVRLLLHLPGASAVGYVQAARDWRL